MNKVIFGLGAIGIGLSVFASGCGSGSGGVSQGPLSDSQKAIVKSTASNLNAVYGTTNTVATESNVSLASDSSPISSGSTSESNAASPTALQQMTSALMSSASCSFNATPLPTDGDLSGKPFEIKVSGSGCPISLDYTFSSITSNGQQSIQFGYDYAVLSDSFRALNDVDAVSVHGPFNISASSDAGSTSLTGTIHSQAHGTIQFSLVGQETSNQSGSIDAIYKYPDFTADLKINISSNNVTYSINGETLSQDEFANYATNMFGGNGQSSASSSTVTTK